MKWTSHSEQETQQLGYSFAKQLQPGCIVCFFGDLGAGKTTFIKGLVSGAAGIEPDQVNSPTFVYLNIHQGHQTVYHFDLYRLRDADEFLSMGFDEYMYAKGICCIEWSEKIAEIIPPQSIRITLVHAGDGIREIKVEV